MKMAPGQDTSKGDLAATMTDRKRFQCAWAGGTHAFGIIPQRWISRQVGAGNGKQLVISVERSWAADERTVPKIKSQEAIRIPRNADPDALPDFAGFVVTASEP